MAQREDPDPAASKKEAALDGPRGEALEGYLGWLEGRPLAPRSRQAYGHQVRRYLAWLGNRSPVDGDPLADAAARDWAVRDYKRHVKKVDGWKPASVNLALAALDSFYTHLGFGRPVVGREELSARAPRALSEEHQRRLLRIAERASARDRAIVAVLPYTGLRLSELVALDLRDVRASARKGVVVVRSGKGDAYREVPLNALVRQVLEEWLAERAEVAATGESALWVGRGGGRLGKRSVDDVVRGLGHDAGVKVSAHTLRHTFLTGMVRRGVDLVLVAEFAGHRRLETTRRYSLPSDADRLLAVEGLPTGKRLIGTHTSGTRGSWLRACSCWSRWAPDERRPESCGSGHPRRRPPAAQRVGAADRPAAAVVTIGDQSGRFASPPLLIAQRCVAEECACGDACATSKRRGR
jgi:integrase/recombinase XerC